MHRNNYYEDNFLKVYVCFYPQALKLLRTAEFKAFVVLIKPPSLERLKATRGERNAKSTFDEKNSRPFTVSSESRPLN